MKTLQKTKWHVVGMSLNTNDLQKCHDCIVSKIVCRSFPKSISPQEHCPLDLLHMDIDVINIPGRLGKKYVLFLTNDHSGFRFGFPGSRLSHALARLYLNVCRVHCRIWNDNLEIHLRQFAVICIGVHERGFCRTVTRNGYTAGILST
jgi:hypothetical protein